MLINLRSLAPMVVRPFCALALMGFFQSGEKHDDIYNILWVLVFGFATLNILALVARQFDDRRRYSMGEILAVLVVIVAVVLLASEMLYQFKIFPIKLSR